MQMKLKALRTLKMAQAMNFTMLKAKIMSLTTAAKSQAMTRKGPKKTMTQSHMVKACSCSLRRASKRTTLEMSQARPPINENAADMMSKLRTCGLPTYTKSKLCRKKATLVGAASIFIA